MTIACPTAASPASSTPLAARQLPVSRCRHPQVGAHAGHDSIDLDIRPVEVLHDDEVMTARWSDGHSSSFALEWLHRHRYGVTDGGVDLPPYVTWDASLQSALPEIDHDDVMADDGALLRFVEQSDPGSRLARRADDCRVAARSKSVG